MKPNRDKKHIWSWDRDETEGVNRVGQMICLLGALDIINESVSSRMSVTWTQVRDYDKKLLRIRSWRDYVAYTERSVEQL